MAGSRSAWRLCSATAMALPLGALPRPCVPGAGRPAQTCQALGATHRSDVHRPCTSPASWLARTRASGHVHGCVGRSAGRSVSCSSGARSDGWLSGADEQYWREKVAQVDLPAARKMAQQLDWSNRMGIPGGTSARGYQLVKEVFAWKAEHPQCVLLVRVGDFYEAQGYDAVMMVEHAGLNQMGNKVKAGTQKSSIRRALNSLQLAGLDIAVVEEVGTLTARGRPGKKHRIITQIVRPEDPVYVHGYMEEGESQIPGGVEWIDREVLAVEYQPASGWNLLLFVPRTGVYRYLRQQPFEAVRAQLSQGTVARVYLPRSSVQREGVSRAAWRRAVDQLIRQEGYPREYFEPATGATHSDAWAKHVLAQIMRHQDMSPDVTPVRQPAAQRGYLPESTALNLGISRSAAYVPGLVPDLLDVALDGLGRGSAARAWMQRLLFAPPEWEQAQRIAEVCRLIERSSAPWPAQRPVESAKLARLLGVREADPPLFRDLHGMLAGFEDLADSHAEASGIVVQIANAEFSSATSLSQLRECCVDVKRRIGAVVQIDDARDASPVLPASYEAEDALLHDAAGTSSEDEDGEGAQEDARPRRTARSTAAQGLSVRGTEGLYAFISVSERGFRGWLVPETIREVLDRVDTCAGRVQEELSKTSEVIWSAVSRKFPEVEGLSLSVRHSPADRTVSLVLAGASPPKIAPSVRRYVSSCEGIQHPLDSKGKPRKQAFVTSALADATRDYLAACEHAQERVRRALKDLSKSLDKDIALMCSVSTCTIIFEALRSHVVASRKRRWCEAELLRPNEADRADAAVKGMWPYWMDPQTSGFEVVCNDVPLGVQICLTGPNMGGKSSLLRSVCATALLANCGLRVPAASAVVPTFDCILLRTFSADSPADGKSAFAIEAAELRHAFDTCSPSSLVLIDELGRSTDANAGQAIAAATLAHFDRLRCTSIFATHLQGLRYVPLELAGTVAMRMGAREESGGGMPAEGATLPTMALCEGWSLDSLALRVLKAEGLSADFLRVASDVLGKEVAFEEGHGRPYALRLARPWEVYRGHRLVGRGPSIACPDAPAVEQSGGAASTARPQPPSRAPAVPGVDPHNHEMLMRTFEPSPVPAIAQEADPTDADLPAADVQTVVAVMEDVCDGAATVLPPGTTVPAGHIGCSCVYALVLPGGIYVGQSDRMEERLREHQQRFSAPFEAVVVAVANSGDARRAETKAIRAFTAQAVPLVSYADGRHGSFGGM